MTQCGTALRAVNWAHCGTALRAVNWAHCGSAVSVRLLVLCERRTVAFHDTQCPVTLLARIRGSRHTLATHLDFNESLLVACVKGGLYVRICVETVHAIVRSMLASPSENVS